MNVTSAEGGEFVIPKTMKAVVLTEPAQAENVRPRDVPVPQIRPGWVLVRIRAFGLNHSEQILRLSEIQADYIQKPIIPGIECVGEVADPSDSSFHEGQKVCLQHRDSRRRLRLEWF